MNVQIINKSKHATPNYETDGAAGMDLRANIESSIVLQPLERAREHISFHSKTTKDVRYVY